LFGPLLKEMEEKMSTKAHWNSN